MTLFARTGQITTNANPSFETRPRRRQGKPTIRIFLSSVLNSALAGISRRRK